MYDPDKAIDELYEETETLKAELQAHRENEGDECPLCALEEENDALKRENEALRKGHWNQLAETDYCYMCGEHSHNHAEGCLLLTDTQEMSDEAIC